jgi:hypothetical protein
MTWVGHGTCMGRRRMYIGFLWGTPEGNRSPGRPRHRWEVNIKMNLTELGWGAMDWIYLA